MNHTTIPSDLTIESPLARTASPSRALAWLYRLARRAVFFRLHPLRHGAITIVEGHQRHTFGDVTAAYPLHATITVHDAHTYADLALGGTIGAADAFRWGLWTCDNLTTLVRIFVQNRELLEGMEGGLAKLTKPLLKAIHWLNRTRKQAARKTSRPITTLATRCSSNFSTRP